MTFPMSPISARSGKQNGDGGRRLAALGWNYSIVHAKRGVHYDEKEIGEMRSPPVAKLRLFIAGILLPWKDKTAPLCSTLCSTSLGVIGVETYGRGSITRYRIVNSRECVRNGILSGLA
jgi:hypothetical protein